MSFSTTPLAIAVGLSILAPTASLAAMADLVKIANDRYVPVQSFELAGEQLSATGPSRANDTLPEFAFAPLDLNPAPKTGRRSQSANSQKAEISASNDGGSATFKLVHTVSETTLTQPSPGNDRFDWGGRLSTLSLVVSAPFDKSAKESPIITSAGLPSDFSAKIGLSVVFWSGAFSFDARVKYRKALITACQDKLSKEAPPRSSECEGMNEDDLDRYATDTLKDQVTQDSLSPIGVSAWLAGVDASAGYQKFDFFDVATAAKDSRTGTPWSASAYLGWIPGFDAPLLLVRAEFQDKFKAGTTGTLCPLPVPAPAVLPCVTGALGAPKETGSFVGTFELRRQLTFDGSLHKIGIDGLGIDAKFAYDTSANVYGFDLPLSFAVDDKGNLVGGIDFGWQSDHHEFIAGIFLNSAFSLLP